MQPYKLESCLRVCGSKEGRGHDETCRKDLPETRETQCTLGKYLRNHDAPRLNFMVLMRHKSIQQFIGLPKAGGVL